MARRIRIKKNDKNCICIKDPCGKYHLTKFIKGNHYPSKKIGDYFEVKHHCSGIPERINSQIFFEFFELIKGEKHAINKTEAKTSSDQAN